MTRRLPFTAATIVLAIGHPTNAGLEVFCRVGPANVWATGLFDLASLDGPQREAGYG
jgi:hypothetical protein